jgi:biopolymer transport protein ExbB
MTKFISPLGLVALLVLAAVTALGATAAAQEFDPPQPGITDDQDAIQRLAEPAEDTEASDPSQPTGIDLITLFTRGGYFMWPIGLMSLLVVAMSVERIVSFRRGRMIPRRLVRRLGELVREGHGSIDAERAFQLCRDYPSSASRVVSAMLMRTGRPLAEIEAAASETAQREADANAGPIRWLNLAAAATPLMGLLGTVWGMIVAFHNSSNLTADRSRSEQLSEGIYTALVTTLAGLAVAIPAAILAQYLENRLGKLFRKIEVLAFSLAPSLEHYAGRQRMDSEARLRPINRAAGSEAPPLAVARSNDAARPIDGERRTRGTPVSDASLGETTTGQR